MSFTSGLKCRECGREYPEEALHVCEFCFGPLEVVYDYEKIKGAISRESIERGPRSIWRYKELLPASSDLDIGTGYTPLIKADNLAAELGLKELYLKNDTLNPTWSFKDRVVSVALAKAIELGYDTIACASTGNLANSVAAHAAKAGLKCYVFIPRDLEPGKIMASAVYGPNLVAVDGNYDDVNRLCSEVAGQYDWAFVNITIRPYYAEGSKTLGFETVEQLGWKVPDHVVIPVASGSMLTKIHKSFKEMHKVGLLDEEPNVRVSAAQAEGCNPVTTAFKNNTFNVKPVKPDTIAKSLAIGNPADGYYGLKVLEETGGSAEDASDEEIVEGIKLLARTEGIFAETAGGVTVACLKKLVETGKIDKDETTVAYITGGGLKTLEAVADDLGVTMVIEPTLEAFSSSLESVEARSQTIKVQGLATREI